MPVDFDKVKKLIRLANNNPNDNEANLAARKVCKMLENINFINPVKQQAKPEPVVQSASNPSKSSHEWVKQRYTKPSEPPFDPFVDFSAFDFQSIFNEAVREEAKRTKPSTADEYSFKDYTRDYPYNSTGHRLLNCRRCGNSFSTKFVGNANMYQCYACAKDEYEENKK